MILGVVVGKALHLIVLLCKEKARKLLAMQKMELQIISTVATNLKMGEEATFNIRLK